MIQMLDLSFFFNPLIALIILVHFLHVVNIVVSVTWLVFVCGGIVAKLTVFWYLKLIAPQMLRLKNWLLNS